MNEPAPNKEKRFIAAFAAAFFAFLALIFLAATIVDPHNDFGTGLLRPLVMTNRTEKLDAIAKMSPAPKIMIFGSSRVFGIDPELIQKITGKPAYNASVSYARPEDDWAMINHIVSNLGINPETIIVGLNLGELNNDNIEPQTINNKYLKKYLNITPAEKLKSIYRALRDSINQKYIRDIFVSIFKLNIKANRTGLQTQDFLPNGKIAAPLNYSAGEPGADFSGTYHRALALFQNTKKLNPSRKLYLENLVAFANQRNIKVKIILLPMPDAVLDKLYRETDYEKLYAEFTNYAFDMRNAYQFDFYDFSSVDKFGGKPGNFDDATHPGAININKITEKIL